MNFLQKVKKTYQNRLKCCDIRFLIRFSHIDIYNKIINEIIQFKHIK